MVMPNRVMSPGNTEQDDAEGHQTDHGADEAQPQAQSGFGEVADVLGQPLVGVVGTAFAFELVVVAIGQPEAEVLFGQPTPPVDGQCLGQVEPVHGQQDGRGRQAAEIQHQPDESGQVAGLQGIVEIAIPSIQGNRQAYSGQGQGDDHTQ
ncbi:hypothetical protein Q3H58_001675 [Pseudomonas psychrotolerans]|nr:hypothetical protein [Pseudomonas psychrotolerans]